MAKFYYSDTFDVELGEKHRFPMRKYRMLREKLLEDKILGPTQLYESSPIERDKLILAHDKDYVDGVLNLTLDAKKARPIGLPLTQEMVKRAIVSMNASLMAAESALEFGVGAALSSGTHHAGYDQGEGFCFFNDFAVIARCLLDKKILIIDLDVHQGNGNGNILKNDSHVTILDIFCQDNYPFRKDISANGIALGLSREVEDDEYLSHVKKSLNQVQGEYDLILFQAGVDILGNDEFGKFNISIDGVGERDRLVFDFAKTNKTPISFVIGGGYGKDLELTVAAYAQTFAIAKEIIDF